MKTTPTLGLKLYDGTDAPDLVSGYNASMEVLEDARIMRFLGSLLYLTPDFNNLKSTGYYNADGYAFSESNHGPVGSFPYGTLVVYDRCIDPASRTCSTQQYFPRKDGTGDAYRPMMRTFADGAWSAWAPLVDVPDVEGALPANGAAGQVLVKSSASDYDCEWVNPSALTHVLSLGSSVKISEDHEAGEDFNNLVNAGVKVVTLNGGGPYPAFISYSLASSSGSINNMPAIGAIVMPVGISISITAILPVPKPNSTEILAIPLIITVRKAYKSVLQLSSNDAGYTIKGIRVTPFVYSIGEAS